MLYLIKKQTTHGSPMSSAGVPFPNYLAIPPSPHLTVPTRHTHVPRACTGPSPNSRTTPPHPGPLTPKTSRGTTPGSSESASRSDAAWRAATSSYLDALAFLVPSAFDFRFRSAEWARL